MNRRGLLGAILAMGAAPALASAGSLMKVVQLDDAPRLQRMLDAGIHIPIGDYHIRSTLVLRSGSVFENLSLTACRSFDGVALLTAPPDVSYVTVRGCHFDGSNIAAHHIRLLHRDDTPPAGAIVKRTAHGITWVRA